MKKKHIIIMITSIIGSLLLIIASLGIYFVVLREPVDPFACVDISTTGLSGSGIVSVVKNQKNEECRVLNKMEYNLDKRDNISNGDEVVMTVKTNSFLWFQYRIKPITTSKVYKISTLKDLPASWDMLSDSDKDKINAVMDERLNIFKGVAKLTIENNTKQSIGEFVDTRIDSELVNVWYRQSAEQTCNPSAKLHCDSIAYIYKLTPNSNDPNYYYDGEAIYTAIILTGVYYDEEQELVVTVYDKRELSAIDPDYEVIASELQGLDFKAV